MSIQDLQVLGSRHKQGEAIKSKDWEQFRKKVFQDDDSLWNDTQLTLNGFEEHKFNLNLSENIQNSYHNHNTTEKCQEESFNSRRLKSLNRPSISRTKIIESYLPNKNEIIKQIQSEMLQNECSNASKYWQNTWHITACLWYLIGYLELNYLDDQNAWINQVKNQHWWEIYFASLYWSLTLMSTGSNSCFATLEIMFTTIILLFTSIFFGYIVTVIGDILSEMSTKDLNKKQDTNTINKYMRQNNISEELQAKVNMYLQQYYQNNFLDEQSKKEQVLEKLPTDLLEHLKREQFKGFIIKLDNLFNKMFSVQTLQELCIFMQEEFFLPDQILSQSREQSLQFIIQGQLIEFQNEEQFNKNKNIGQKLNVGDNFGLVDFISGISSNSFVISTMFTKIIKINRIDFLKIISKNDLEYQKFCEAKDKIVFYQQFKEINLRCNLCNSYYHQQAQCELVNINKKQLYCMQKYNITQKRKFFQRQMSKNYNPVLIQQDVSAIAYSFINEIKKQKQADVIQLLDLTLSDTDDTLSDEEIIEKKKFKYQETLKEFQPKNNSSTQIQCEQSQRRQTVSSLNLKKMSKELEVNKLANKIENLNQFNIQDQQKGLDFNQIQKSEFFIDKVALQGIDAFKQNSLNSLNEKQRAIFKDYDKNINQEDSENQRFSIEKIDSLLCINNSIKQLFPTTYKNNNDTNSKLNHIINYLVDNFASSSQKENLQQSNKQLTNSQKLLNQLNFHNNKKSSLIYNLNQFQNFQEMNFQNMPVFCNQFIDYQFDQQRDFLNYFPEGNLKEVISKFQRSNRKKIRRTQKSIVVVKI